MGKKIEKLISISGNQLSQKQATLDSDIFRETGKLGKELGELLYIKNGFFSFESALRVFPIESSELSIGLLDWNADRLWKKDYLGLADGLLFFAEDIFGGQFCIKNEAVCSFDPETGATEEMASNIENWAEELLNDYNVLTGYSLAHEWQEENGVLPCDERLLPKVPFVCGGKYELDNLMPIQAVSGMRTRANLARQILDMPDGTQIEFKIVD